METGNLSVTVVNWGSWISPMLMTPFTKFTEGHR